LPRPIGVDGLLWPEAVIIFILTMTALCKRNAVVLFA